MNSWCESCAKKSQCYTAEIRPKCYVATTNTDTHYEAIKARAEQTDPTGYKMKPVDWKDEMWQEAVEQTEPISELCHGCKHWDDGE